jgi:hypothetical protein
MLLSRKTAAKKMAVYSIYPFEADRFMTLDRVVLLEEMEKHLQGENEHRQPLAGGCSRGGNNHLGCDWSR